MYKTKLRDNESLLDVTVRCYGSSDKLVDLCLDNGFFVGQEVKKGTEIIIYSEKIANKRIVEYLKTI